MKGHGRGSSGCPWASWSCMWIYVCMYVRRVESTACIGFSTGKVKNFCPAAAVWIPEFYDPWHVAQLAGCTQLRKERQEFERHVPFPSSSPPNKSPSYCVKDAEPGAVSSWPISVLARLWAFLEASFFFPQRQNWDGSTFFDFCVNTKVLQGYKMP